jgi:hypothetical protein
VPAISPNENLSFAQVRSKSIVHISTGTSGLSTGRPPCGLIGLLLGSSIPAMTFGLVHFVLPNYPDDRIVLWVITVGDLAFSAPKVFRWCDSAWGSKFEAAGMVLLLEGKMTFVHGLWLPLIALFVIVFINGVYSACRLQIRK